MKKLRIVFICKHNVFRSRVAESYFKKINKNKNIIVSSRGLFPKGKNSPNQIKAMKQEKIFHLSKSRSLNIPFLKKQDLIIMTANDIPIKIFNNKEYIKKLYLWKIPDVLNDNFKDSQNTINLIKNKIEKLVKELEKKYNENKK